MSKQIGQSVNSATSPPAPANRGARAPNESIHARRIRPARRSLATCEVLRGLAIGISSRRCCSCSKS